MRRLTVRAIVVTALTTAALPLAGAVPATALSASHGPAVAVVSSLPTAAQDPTPGGTFKTLDECQKYGNQFRNVHPHWHCLAVTTRDGSPGYRYEWW